MDEDLFVKLLDLRRYLHSQADKLIDAGFDVNSEVIGKFFDASSDIIKHIEKITRIYLHIISNLNSLYRFFERR